MPPPTPGWREAMCFSGRRIGSREDSLEVAYEHAKTAVTLDDNLPLGHAVLGWVQMWRKEANEALSSGRHAVALDPNNADAQLFLSITLSALGRGKESLNYIRSAIRLNPHPSTLYLMALGISYYVLGQFEEAIEAYQRGIELRPLSHQIISASRWPTCG